MNVNTLSMLKFYEMVIPEYSKLDSKSMGPILETQRGIIFNSFVLKYTAFVFLELNLWNHYIFLDYLSTYTLNVYLIIFLKEIKYELSWMLQNNFQGREMLFCNEEADAFHVTSMILLRLGESLYIYRSHADMQTTKCFSLDV